MESTISRDRTAITWYRSGMGDEPLLFVHGTAADHNRWRPVLPAFEQSHLVCALDRRGRGESGDSEKYTIEREFEDIAAVIDAQPGPVTVIAHSFGALCTLEAALHTGNLRSLILYEPPIYAGTEMYPQDAIAKLEALSASGDREGTVLFMYRTVAGISERETELARAHPSWKDRIAAAHTIPREIRAQSQYRFIPERFVSLRLPVLMLLGGGSPAVMKNATDLVQASLPNSRVHTFPEEGHIAMTTAPDQFIRVVMEFLA